MADGCIKVLTFILKRDVFGFKVKCLSIIEGLHRHEKIEKNIGIMLCSDGKQSEANDV